MRLLDTLSYGSVDGAIVWFLFSLVAGPGLSIEWAIMLKLAQLFVINILLRHFRPYTVGSGLISAYLPCLHMTLLAVHYLPI